jgi:hypothetical protein
VSVLPVAKYFDGQVDFLAVPEEQQPAKLLRELLDESTKERNDPLAAGR